MPRVLSTVSHGSLQHQGSNFETSVRSLYCRLEKLRKNHPPKQAFLLLSIAFRLGMYAVIIEGSSFRLSLMVIEVPGCTPG